MKDLHTFFYREVESCSSPLKEILGEILARPGKGMRSRLLFLAAKTGRPEEKRLNALAAGIELLHLASLVHDDLLDRGEMRRGYPALWKTYGVEAAVLTGDFLLAAAYKTLAFSAGFFGLERINRLLQGMVEAELEQKANSFKVISVPHYLQRVDKKTARFFQTACELGAEAGGLSREKQDRLGKFGRNIGMAYQILDDLLDVLGDPVNTGKPVFQDLKNGVLTLPFLLLRPKTRLKKYLSAVREEKQVSPALQKMVRQLLVEQGVLSKVEHKIEQYFRQAKRSLLATEGLEIRSLLEFLDGLRLKAGQDLSQLEKCSLEGWKYG